MSDFAARLTTALVDRHRIERELGAGRLATVSLTLLVLCAGTPLCLRAQCPDGSPPPCNRAAPRPTLQPTSLAVLYFENASRDTADAYLAEGITEEIISRLSEVGRLQVEWLGRAFEERTAIVAWVRQYPELAVLPADPRYAALDRPFRF